MPLFILLPCGVGRLWGAQGVCTEYSKLGRRVSPQERTPTKVMCDSRQITLRTLCNAFALHSVSSCLRLSLERRQPSILSSMLKKVEPTVTTNLRTLPGLLTVLRSFLMTAQMSRSQSPRSSNTKGVAWGASTSMWSASTNRITSSLNVRSNSKLRSYECTSVYGHASSSFPRVLVVSNKTNKIIVLSGVKINRNNKKRIYWHS